MASNLATFKTLLAERLDKGQRIPNLVLKNNNDLGQDFTALVTSDKPVEGETQGQRAARYLDEVCDDLNKPEYGPLVAKFDDVVDTFSDKVKATWTAIEGIRELSKQMAEKMETLTNTNLAADEFVVKYGNYDKLVSEFPVFGWDGTKIMGSIDTVIQHVNGLMTQDGEASTQINRNLYNIVISDMSKYGKVEDVAVTEDTYKSALEAMQNVCQTSTEGDIKNALDALTGINKNCPICPRLDSLKRPEEAQTKLMENIKVFDGVITALFPILDLVAGGQVVPFPEAKDVIVSNAKKLIVVLELAAYYEYMYRSTTFQEVILLQGGLINSDAQDAFKEAGGTPQMLAEFARFMYNDDLNKVPVTGIKFKDIVDGAGAVSEKVKKDITSVMNKVTIVKNNARMLAFNVVMRECVTKKIDRDFPTIPLAEAAEKIEDIMKEVIYPIRDDIRQYNINFTDAAMRGIVAAEYKGTLVERLIKQLGVAYVAATEENGNITAADLTQVDISVISNLMCSYLIDTLIDIIPGN